MKQFKITLVKSLAGRFKKHIATAMHRPCTEENDIYLMS